MTLINVTRNATGLYRCEVSEDAPSFHTLEMESRMQVVGESRTHNFIYSRQLQYYIRSIVSPLDLIAIAVYTLGVIPSALHARNDKCVLLQSLTRAHVCICSFVTNKKKEWATKFGD